MENLTTAYSLLKRSSKKLYDHRTNRKFFCSIRSSNSGLNYNSIQAFEPFKQVVRFHKPILSLNNFCFLRGSGIGIPDALSRVQGGGYQIHCRNVASMASTPMRYQSFAMINSDDISYFKKILGERGVVQEEEKLDDANTDWMRKYKGSIVGLCYNQEAPTRCLAVVPQGGNTGLVGGSVPVFDEVIINISSMNNILSFDKASGILVCETGCILEKLTSFLENEG